MDFNRQNNQPSSGHVPFVQQPQAPVHGGKKSRRRPQFRLSKNPVGWGLLLIAVVLIVFGVLWTFRTSSDEISQVNTKEYQAIFLTSGQVYFGKLVAYNNDYAKITNIFYLQVNQTVQPDQKNNNSSQPQNVSLVKLGNEIHGPEDEMIINPSQISFWENLKPSGKVSQAIQRYYQNGGSSSGSTSAPASTSNNLSTGSTSSTNSTNNSTSSSTPSSSTSSNTSTSPAK